MLERAMKEVGTLRQMPPLPMVEDGHNGEEILPSPVQWWAFTAHELPLFPQVARVCIGYSYIAGPAGATVLESWLNRDNVELLATLRNFWAAVDATRNPSGQLNYPL